MLTEQLSLVYNGKPPSARGSATSKIAADSMVQSASGLRRRVLDFIRASPNGATCDEIEERLLMRHQTASARCRELALLDQVEKRMDRLTGKEERRPTRSGRLAAVLYAVDHQPRAPAPASAPVTTPATPEAP